jgi:hypothetical protein
MPPVRALATNDHLEAHPCEKEQSQAREACPGFWRSLIHGMTLSLTPIPSERHAPACRPFEAPMDRLVQENTCLSLLALAII